MLAAAHDTTTASLREPIAAQKRVIRQPSARNQRGAQQRQHHVATAAHERTGTVEQLRESEVAMRGAP